MKIFYSRVFEKENNDPGRKGFEWTKRRSPRGLKPPKKPTQFATYNP